MDLRVDKSEIKVAAIKGLAGAVPVVGPIVAELLGAVIPSKRLERIEETIEALETKLAHLEASGLREAFADPATADLLEEGLFQSARAISPERRRQVAAVVGNAVLNSDLPKIEQKRLLSILGELNEIELKILFAHSLHFKHERPEYLAKNPEAAQPRPMFPEFERRNALYESYIAHLEQLRLLSPEYESQPELRIKDLTRAGTSPPRVVGHSLSRLGRLLLEAVDLVPREV